MKSLLLAITLLLLLSTPSFSFDDSKAVYDIVQIIDNYENFDKNPRSEEMRERLKTFVQDFRLAVIKETE